MKLEEFRFLADENIDPELVTYLREQGFDIKDANDVGWIASKDNAWIELAKLEERVILTQDSDFGKIIFTQTTDFFGIIFLRPGLLSGTFHIRTMQAIFSAKLVLSTPFILTAKNTKESVRLKIRQL